MTKDPDSRLFAKNLIAFAMDHELVCRQRDALLHAAEALIADVDAANLGYTSAQVRLVEVVAGVRRVVQT